jgi:hypothetical protein
VGGVREDATTWLCGPFAFLSSLATVPGVASEFIGLLTNDIISLRAVCSSGWPNGNQLIIELGRSEGNVQEILLHIKRLMADRV